MVRRFAVIALGALVLGAGPFVGSSIAKPGTVRAASCGPTGPTCDGLDPVLAGCDTGVVTLDTFTYGQVEVQLRYSSSCSAMWARSAGSYSGKVHIGVFRYRCPKPLLPNGACNSYPLVLNLSEGVYTYSGGWTDMLDDSQFGINACEDESPPYPDINCTFLWHAGQQV